MDYVKRNTKRYNFKSPDLTKLRKLGSLVSSPEDFRGHYGKLLSILKTNVEEGILNTLVQFYDPLYHCFTFPDFQLVPTLEEYSYLVGLPIPDKVPFTGLEPTPKPQTIANALHLETSLVKAKLILKEGLLGLPAKFLYQQASVFAEIASNDAFYSILALLIYGLVLFPNIDNFVDINTIQIFLTKNPVPTLLADTNHSIHHRTQKGTRVIICCTPVLYRWFIAHLPKTACFKENPSKLRWAQRIMSLTSADIVLYDAAYDVGAIIDSCGEFPNVPLLGMRGGITYSPILARRQFGYHIKDKPNSLLLTSVFYLNQEGSSDTRNRCVQAWRTIHRKEKNQLGRRLGFVSESYNQWVIDRAAKLGMPYPIQRPLFSVTSSSLSSPLPFDTKEEFQEILAKLRREKDAWKTRCQAAERENETLRGKLEQKDHELFAQSQEIVKKNVLLQRKNSLLSSDPKRRKHNMDLFTGSQSDSDDPPASEV
ncbi:hypothetical protein QL285_003266 [Trifolium repens]|nr:hypothetical protein QL285_003266 [Trifolium repens]